MDEGIRGAVAERGPSVYITLGECLGGPTPDNKSETSDLSFIQRLDPLMHPHPPHSHISSLDNQVYRCSEKSVLTSHPAHKYGVSTYQLALVNEATISESCDNLQPDQEICLGIEGHDCTKVYTVVADE